MADPRALEQCIAAMQTVHFLGTPEGDQALAQAAIYLSVPNSSDAAAFYIHAPLQEARNDLH